MYIHQILKELEEEKIRIEQAIQSLERLGGIRRRRGRPPKWSQIVKAPRAESSRKLSKLKASKQNDTE